MRTVQTWPAATEGCNGPLQLTADRVDCWFVSLAAFPADAESLAVAILSKDDISSVKGNATYAVTRLCVFCSDVI
jgi:hypothetical protein